jgi:hypothetical protein
MTEKCRYISEAVQASLRRSPDTDVMRPRTVIYALRSEFLGGRGRASG